MTDFSPMGTSVSVSATGSSVSGAITMPSGSNAMHIANTSATLYVTVGADVDGALTLTLGTSLTLPPMSQIVIPANPLINIVAAIGSAAGPTAVVFTPGRIS